MQAALPALRAGSARRLAADPAFQDLRRQVDRLRSRLSSGTVSLNEAERRREQTEDKRLDDAIAAQVRRQSADIPTYEITVKDAGRAGLPPRLVATPPAKSDKVASRGPAPEFDVDPSEQHPADQLVLTEALRVLVDYVQLRTTANGRT